MNSFISSIYTHIESSLDIKLIKIKFYSSLLCVYGLRIEWESKKLHLIDTVERKHLSSDRLPFIIYKLRVFVGHLLIFIKKKVNQFQRWHCLQQLHLIVNCVIEFWFPWIFLMSSFIGFHALKIFVFWKYRYETGNYRWFTICFWYLNGELLENFGLWGIKSVGIFYTF